MGQYRPVCPVKVWEEESTLDLVSCESQSLLQESQHLTLGSQKAIL